MSSATPNFDNLFLKGTSDTDISSYKQRNVSTLQKVGDYVSNMAASADNALINTANIVPQVANAIYHGFGGQDSIPTIPNFKTQPGSSKFVGELIGSALPFGVAGKVADLLGTGLRHYLPKTLASPSFVKEVGRTLVSGGLGGAAVSKNRTRGAIGGSLGSLVGLPFEELGRAAVRAYPHTFVGRVAQTPVSDRVQAAKDRATNLYSDVRDLSPDTGEVTAPNYQEEANRQLRNFDQLTGSKKSGKHTETYLKKLESISGTPSYDNTRDLLEEVPYGLHEDYKKYKKGDRQGIEQLKNALSQDLNPELASTFKDANTAFKRYSNVSKYGDRAALNTTNPNTSTYLRQVERLNPEQRATLYSPNEREGASRALRARDYAARHNLHTSKLGHLSSLAVLGSLLGHVGATHFGAGEELAPEIGTLIGLLLGSKTPDVGASILKHSGLPIGRLAESMMSHNHIPLSRKIGTLGGTSLANLLGN